ncbi:MAG: cytochrome P450 [Acidimicrobiia bacterium]
MVVRHEQNESDLYWDPWDYDLHRDSHPTWRRMREEAPLYRNDEHDFWALTRFQDVLDVLVDWKTYSSAQGDIIELIRGGVPESSKSLIFEDPPEHDLHRQMLSRAFTPKAVQRIEDRVRAFVREMLDERIGSGGFDFVDDFGARVPGMVIAAMLGTPDSDLDDIRHLVDAQLHLDPGDPLDRSQYNDNAALLVEYFLEHARARRQDPQDDLMSALVTLDFTDEEGVTRPLRDKEAASYIKLLASAGNETTARFTGWAGAVLAEYPDQRAVLVARPDLIPNAVEEILRYEPPSMALARVVQRDVVWYDQLIPAGSALVLVTAATGRDQRQFEEPDRLDVERKIERHLSFGFGLHVCMGASLARMEARIILEEMLARFPEWDVVWDETDIVHTGSAVRGYCKLPIVL